ncbi:MAG TPA: MoxR family ATPase, partial [Phototrophicaceae bacterium]|nr:MoxR family ATPase [Phototrophicaceae bacterium]
MVTHETLFETGITEALAIRGWAHLDAVILAALATEAPLLLVGPHGTAKSLLVERIAAALGLDMRHYNAALLNYDDLVGIPLPDEAGNSLRFIQTPGTIWGAGFVFFDEISRCRADLQNKLFPIIHERRVVGIQLDQLRFRWAAMNPPAPDEPDQRSLTNAYY